MARIHAALLFGFTLALAACDDSATRPIVTAPDAGPTFDAAATGFTPVGGGDAILLTDDVGTEQAATGGRASGHADIVSTQFGLAEKYSFVALSTDPFPNAKGQMQGTIVNAAGTVLELHIEVDCLAITGNQAWVSGPAKKFVINGVPQPTNFDAQFRVQDNGEGANSPPDLASVLFFSSPQGCQFRPALPMTPSEDGNIQVRER
jgi:hypothetical protein